MCVFISAEIFCVLWNILPLLFPFLLSSKKTITAYTLQFDSLWFLQSMYAHVLVHLTLFTWSVKWNLLPKTKVILSFAEVMGAVWVSAGPGCCLPQLPVAPKPLGDGMMLFPLCFFILPFLIPPLPIVDTCWFHILENSDGRLPI